MHQCDMSVPIGDSGTVALSPPVHLQTDPLFHPPSYTEDPTSSIFTSNDNLPEFDSSFASSNSYEPCTLNLSCNSEPKVSILKNKSSNQNKFSKHRQKRIKFDVIETYLFHRSQGFACVPTQGGSTLGMKNRHWAMFTCSVTEHEVERRYERRNILYDEYLKGKLHLSTPQIEMLERALESFTNQTPKTSEICNSNAACSLNPSSSCVTTVDFQKTHATCEQSGGQMGNPNQPQSDAFSYYSDAGQDENLTAEETIFLRNLEENYFLQPVALQTRRNMLRQAGVQRIEQRERNDCQAIRISRDTCGCACPDGRCLPETCFCAINGIPCQVDRPSFPCSCQLNSCFNEAGRVEFNPIRVRTHSMHTLMRLEMERNHHSPDIKQVKFLTTYELTESDSDEPIVKQRRTDTANMSSSSSKTDELGVVSDHTNCQIAHGDIATSDVNIPTDNEQAVNGELDNDDFLQTFNSTSKGGCRDCQNDRLISALMRELEQHQDEQVFCHTPTSHPWVPDMSAMPNRPIHNDVPGFLTATSSAASLIPKSSVYGHPMCSLITDELTNLDGTCETGDHNSSPPIRHHSLLESHTDSEVNRNTSTSECFISTLAPSTLHQQAAGEKSIDTHQPFDRQQMPNSVLGDMSTPDLRSRETVDNQHFSDIVSEEESDDESANENDDGEDENKTGVVKVLEMTGVSAVNVQRVANVSNLASIKSSVIVGSTNGKSLSTHDREHVQINQNVTPDSTIHGEAVGNVDRMSADTPLPCMKQPVSSNDLHCVRWCQVGRRLDPIASFLGGTANTGCTLPRSTQFSSPDLDQHVLTSDDVDDARQVVIEEPVQSSIEPDEPYVTETQSAVDRSLNSASSSVLA